MYRLTSGINKYLIPSPAPSSVIALKKSMISTRYGNVAVKYTT